MVIAACAATIASTTAAQASDAPAADKILIDVSATVAERCGISADGSSSNNNANLDAATRLEFGFKIDCNTRFRIGVSSLNGAMKLVGKSLPNNGFSDEKAYRVGLRVETDDAPLTPEDCTSHQLRGGDATCAFFGEIAGQGLSSGQQTAIDRRGSISVSWGAGGSNDEPRRVAGEYSDTLTIVVGVRS